jgi:CspA family cold shock protein
MRNKDNSPSYVGTVLWFRDNLGYGFIETDELKDGSGLNRSIFCHYSRIMTGEQFKTLSKGQVVNFEIAETTKGLMAVNVREHKVMKLKATFVTDTKTQ